MPKKRRRNKAPADNTPELAPQLDQPERGSDPETIVTLGGKDEFAEVEDVDLVALSRRLDISDIPNAVSPPEKPKKAKQKPPRPKKETPNAPKPPKADTKKVPSEPKEERKQKPSELKAASPRPPRPPKPARHAPVDRPSALYTKTQSEDAPVSVLLKGLLTENALLTTLAGICPAAAVAFSGANGFALGVCALVALLVTNPVSSLIGQRLPGRIRVMILILLAAAAASGEELVLRRLSPDLLLNLGVFLPLISVCGLSIARDGFASSHRPAVALVDALAHGIGFTVVLTVVGIIREVVGSGTLFGLDVTFGVLPPAAAFAAPVGGLLVIGLLAALLKYILRRALHGPRPVPKDKEVGV